MRSVASPYYEIEFGNGSRVRGFSSGSSSGAEGVGIRGQDADRIYLDEADYLLSSDLSAITAITITTPSVYVWASSTPTGKRQHFYQWAKSTPTYKEFYFPAMVVPHWEQVREETELEYAGRPDDWTHEILAEFGEQAVGVFQTAYIDRASLAYEYAELQPQHGWIYSMGVDWNNDVGTEIVITGYDNHGGFQVVDATNIPKQEWTQIKGMEAIIRLNEKWRPQFLYMDEGYGSTNVELLKKYGHDMLTKDPADPACALYNSLVSYDFGSKVEVYDPVSKQPIKKDAKPFLVENAVRRFEENSIRISSFDSVLLRQLENYVIDHRTPAGRPTYKVLEESIGDHRLDAFMLSLVAFKLEISDFGQPRYSHHIAISPGFSDGKPEETKEKKALRKANRVPENRFDVDQLSFKYDAGLPAKASSYRFGSQRVCSQEAWATDREKEFQAKWEIKQLKKRMKSRRMRPERKNI